MKINNSVQSNAVIPNEANTTAAKASDAQVDTLEIARHSKKDTCGNYKKKGLFHKHQKSNSSSSSSNCAAPAKGAKGCAVSRPNCVLPAPVVQFHGTMRANANQCVGTTHTFDVMEVEYPGPCHTIPMEYVVGGREHHVTAPDLHITGCPTTQLQPVVRFQPDTIHVYPGNVVDRRPQLNAQLLECQQAECEAPAKAPAADCSSSSCEAPAPAKGAACEVAQEQAQQQAAPVAGSSSTSDQGQAPAQAQVAKGAALKGEAQQAQPAVANFPRKHWRPFK